MPAPTTGRDEACGSPLGHSAGKDKTAYFAYPLVGKSGMPHPTQTLGAAVTTAFFGFFRLGEITVPSATVFDPRVHLCWGDVAVDSTESPTVIHIHLKFSKCDQFGQGVPRILRPYGR